jgi:hypothetical protein
MKAKSLSFVFISFSESGLFNGLSAIQIKKLCASASRHGHVGNAYLSAHLYAAGLARDRRKRKYDIEFDFLQMNVSDPLNAARLEPRDGLVYVDDTARDRADDADQAGRSRLKTRPRSATAPTTPVS